MLQLNEFHANVLARAKQLETPLHVACAGGNMEVANIDPILGFVR